MTKDDLKYVLLNERFNPQIYSLDGGTVDNTLCISQEDGRWCYYFTERGERFDEQWFNTEHEACSYLLTRLRSLPERDTRLPRTSP